MSLGSSTYTWTFDSLYDAPSSLAAVAGNYSDGNATLSINSNGVIFEQDPTSGCVLNGQISLIDARYDVYSVSITDSNCSVAPATAVTLTGLASLNQTVSSATLDLGISGSVNGRFLVFTAQVIKQ